jgi:membrane protein DedA with SNARE-associated domain
MAEPFGMFELPEHLSYLGIIVVLILTGSGLPVPEEVPIIIAGVASAQGSLNPWLAVLCCLVGALLGDCVMYTAGYHFGHNIFREHPWFARFLKPARERRIEQMIAKHGMKVFLFSRFLVGLRMPVYLTAGILRVPFRKFILFDAFCASAVIGTFFGLSYAFADHIRGWWKSIRQLEIGLTVTIVAGLVGVGVYFYVRHQRRLARIRGRRQQRAKLAAAGAEPEKTKSVA